MKYQPSDSPQAKERRFQSHLKDKVVHIRHNMYINPDDPLYYEKILSYIDASSPEAHFNLGQKCESKNQLDKALQHYKEVLRSPSPFYLQAKQGIRRLEQEEEPGMMAFLGSDGQEKGLSRQAKTLLLLIGLVSLAVLVLLFSEKPIKSTLSSFAPWKVGLDVVNEAIDSPYVIYVNAVDSAKSKEIEKLMYDKVLALSKDHPDLNILLYGIQSSDGSLSSLSSQLRRLTDLTQRDAAFVVAEYNARTDESVKIRFIHKPPVTQVSGKNELVIFGTNLVRTALSAYIKDHGQAPPQLAQLAGDYPGNYVSYIPKEALSGSDAVHEAYNGQGGWVYQPKARQLASMFYPNTGLGEQASLPYEPIRVVVGKQEHALAVMSGSHYMVRKQVGLGKNNATPAGSFTVGQRVREPRGKDVLAYGQAALGLGKLAIHGTYEKGSIGGNLSHGCVRVSNGDMAELFPLVPRGASVEIVEGLDSALASWVAKASGAEATDAGASSSEAAFAGAALVGATGTGASTMTLLRPERLPGSVETAKGTIFYWLG